MELKPFYRLADFANLKTSPNAQNYMADCPACGKHHLSINKKSGLYHCFTPECNFNGICEDFRKVRSEDLGVRSKSPAPKKTSRSITNNSFEPSAKASSSRQEHKNALSSAARTSLTTPNCYASLDVHDLSSLEANPAVVKYLAEQQIPLEVAKAAGCMSATRSIDGITYNCLCYVNRLYGSIINVKYRAVTAKKFTQVAQPKDKNVPSAPYNIEALNPLRYSEELGVRSYRLRQPLRVAALTTPHS